MPLRSSSSGNTSIMEEAEGLVTMAMFQGGVLTDRAIFIHLGLVEEVRGSGIETNTMDSKERIAGRGIFILQC